jgi:hypothetical protein
MPVQKISEIGAPYVEMEERNGRQNKGGLHHFFTRTRAEVIKKMVRRLA